MRCLFLLCLAACAGQADPIDVDVAWSPQHASVAAAPGLDLTVEPLAPGAASVITVEGALPGMEVYLARGSSTGVGPCPDALGGLCLDILSPKLIDVLTADVSGTAVKVLWLPEHVADGTRVYFQAAMPNGPESAVSDTVGITVEVECRTTVDPSDFYYDRFEGTHLRNDCLTDRDCVVGGCSAEICAAEGGVSTCEGLPYGPEGSCGCVDLQCQWAEGCS
jgi:eight-cysteine-cluster-containing protein